MVAGQLLELAIAEQIRARVAGVHYEQVGGNAIGHRKGRPHPEERAIAAGALDDGPIRRFEALAKLQ